MIQFDIQFDISFLNWVETTPYSSKINEEETTSKVSEELPAVFHPACKQQELRHFKKIIVRGCFPM